MSDSSTSRRAAATATLCFIAAASGSVHAQRAMSRHRARRVDERSRLSRRARACRHADDGRLSLDRRGERSRPLRRPDVPAARAERHAEHRPGRPRRRRRARRIGVGAAARHRAASISARGLREHSDRRSETRNRSSPRWSEGATTRSSRPPRPRRDDLAQRTCRRHRGHEGAAGIVVRHFDGCNHRTATSGSAREAPARFASRAPTSRDSRTGSRT